MKSHITHYLLITAVFASLSLFTPQATASQPGNVAVVSVTETQHTPTLNSDKSVKKITQKKVELASLSAKSGEQLRSTQSADYWFYDAWVTLYTDRDYDGYFSAFDLEFDADTHYYRAPVYAIVYLGTEDYYEPFHVTDVFELYNDSSEDGVLLENELITGYPSNDYDILIELIDADTDVHVATIDAYSDADLSYQSMESVDYDIPATREVVIESHGGSWGLWTSLMLLLIIISRRLNANALSRKSNKVS
ncbi:MAG: GlyGly-CTERM sorting domain-containing protein [Alteromonadaceae bacterium]|nr:GlyGly-CTERM sorting domain-containing protein [Alteromonadaceae bacterium]